MKSLIQWAIRNTPAMNTLMASVLLVGTASIFMIHRELFPEFELEMIMISVPYPGASPDEVEEGICQKIEEAVQSVDGIKNINSVAREGAGSVILELEANTPDVQKVLNEVRSEIDRIPSLPDLAEDPEVKQITMRREAIQVAVTGPDDSPESELALRNLAEQLRDEILALDSVKQAELVGAKPFQIDIEIPEQTLRKYGLTLQDVARIVRTENIELPGGVLKTDLQEVLLRGKNKQDIGYEIAKIPLVTDPNGVVLTVGDLGKVRDEFEDVASLQRFNRQPAMVVKVEKTSQEDLLKITKEVRAFADNVNTEGGFQTPPGYDVVAFGDMSDIVRDRLSLISRNGLQGLVLVFLLLAIFLEIRLAFWVALGIPVSILGATAMMMYTGETLNMLSMFGYLMALGIVVDDAIVIGENIYAHRQMGKQFSQAAVEGTAEVLPSVLASVSTTIIAFSPLLIVPGVMGKFIAVIPLVVIAMLFISLVESTFILPCHLAHSGEHEQPGQWEHQGPVAKTRRFLQRFPRLIRWTVGSVLLAVVAVGWFFMYPFVRISHVCNDHSSRLLSTLINKMYLPTLRRTLANPGIVLATAIAVLLISAGLFAGGIVPFNVMPKVDGDNVMVNIEYPDGTAASVTDEATRLLEDAIWQLSEQSPTGFIQSIHRKVGQRSATGDVQTGSSGLSGSHVGGVAVELKGAEIRTIKSTDIVNAWRQLVQDGLPDAEGQTRHLTSGYESLSFNTANIGPGGAPIELRLMAPPRDMLVLEEAVEKVKAHIAQYPGVKDIEDDARPGKWEFQLTVRDDAKAMGVPLSDLAGTVRAAYYGEEVMRLQRGRHEVKLMVRYPREDRRNLSNFDDIRVRTGGGAERPLTELANVQVLRGYSKINRLDQMRAITIKADVEEDVGNAQEYIQDMKASILVQLKEEYPQMRMRWGGAQEDKDESMKGLIQGLAIALACMFALLTLEFRSYLQPLLILAVIPFGAIGAVVGHILLQMPLSLMSLFGMVALTGVVVNDSIVLIDFMNSRVRSGMPLVEAIQEAGCRRFRPVLLTSLTTVAALMPILLERSFQAQVVIPMAVSLAFGLMFATLLVLILVPTFYLLYCRYLAPQMTAQTERPEEENSPPAAEFAPADPAAPRRREDAAAYGFQAETVPPSDVSEAP